VQTKRLFSEALGGTVKVRLTTGTLRTIDKYGGLDNYMLRGKMLDKFERASSAMALRVRIREAERANVEQALAGELERLKIS